MATGQADPRPDGAAVAVYAHDLRTPLRPAWETAVRRCPQVRLADSVADADVVVVDAYVTGPPPPPAPRPDQLTVVLSLPHADAVTDGALGLDVDEALEGAAVAMTAHEAELTTSAGNWVTLRCAAFGQEAAWNAAFTRGGAMVASWRPDGAPWLDLVDVVELLPVLRRDPGRWQRAYELSGAAVVPLDDVVRLLEPHHDGPVMYLALPPAEHVAACERAGFDRDFAVRRVAYSSWATSPTCRVVDPTLASALGRSPRQLDEYFLDAVEDVGSSGLARQS